MRDAEYMIRSYFSKLGFTPEIADVYVALHTYGAQSIAELARNSGVERTRLYRMIDELKASGVIEIELQYKRNIFRAAPIDNLWVLVARKEQELASLKDDFKQLKHHLAQKQLQSGETKIQVYRGADGLKQMLWNQTRSKGERVSILYENIQGHTNISFFERWVRRINHNQVSSRSIIGDHFIASQKEWYKNHSNERVANWEARYISADILPITYSTVVYDNITAYFHWKNDEIFGVEIHNQHIADAQRHIFGLLWNHSKPMKGI